MTRRVLIGMMMFVIIADLVQIPFLGLSARLIGPVGGALVYAGGVWGTLKGLRFGPLVGLLVPVLPTSLLIMLAVGVQIPFSPDGPMLVVYCLQLLTALAAVLVLRSPGERQ